MNLKPLHRNILLAIVLVLVVGGISLLEAHKPERAGDDGAGELSLALDTKEKEEKARKFELAKEITTPDGFINVDEVSISELIGKQVILVDFWTYSCINCQRTFPFLNDWHKKYGDKGLTIIGVHTPEFEFEKDYNNVLDATKRFGLEFPVVLDNDFSTWRSYNNRYWPRKYLIDIDGFIVYDHIGEGAYEETEARIVAALNERSERLGEEDIELARTLTEPERTRRPLTPETYLGSARVEYLRNLPAPECLSETCDYQVQPEIELHTYMLQGSWEMNEESATVRSEEGGSIVIGFLANEVNLVAGTSGGGPVQAEIFLNGEPITSEQAGSAVQDGVVTFEAHKLYNLVNLRGNHGQHILHIRFLEPGVSTFAFTFG